MTEAADRAAIERECTALSVAHAYCLDHGEFDDLVELFTKDGVFDRAGPVHRGQDEIREAMTKRGSTITTRHLLTNFHFVSVETDEAAAVVYAMTYHSNDQWIGEPVQYATSNGRLLEFHTAYRRTDAGWRIASLVAKSVLIPPDWPGRR